VSHTPQSASDVCTHERGPGTTLCLHCRREARLVARDKRQRNLLRGTVATIVVAIMSTAGALSARALRSRSETSRKGEANGTPVPQTTDTLAVNSVSPRDSAVTPPANSGSAEAKPVVSGIQSVAPTALPSAARTVAATPAPITTAMPAALPTSATARPKPIMTVKQAGAPMQPVVAKAAVAALAPVIAMGQTTLGDGVVATRTESGVTLAFDTPVTRTRTPEKFERFLRATLPSVYGRDVESALATIPLGALTHQGDLLTELPTRGIRVPVKDAGTLVVYPETRPGQDGPLVIRYRTALVPPGE
jgi:hypothetical protein